MLPVILRKICVTLLLTVEEKPKLTSGKNGAQIPVDQEMPTLDAEPEKNEAEDIKNKTNIDNDKKSEGSNGKIVDKEVSEKNQNEKEASLDNVEDQKKSEEKEGQEPQWVEATDGQIEVEDPDDYLIYLEDILKRIHK